MSNFKKNYRYSVRRCSDFKCGQCSLVGADTLRGAYRADKYRDVIIPMFVLTRLEAMPTGK